MPLTATLDAWVDYRGRKGFPSSRVIHSDSLAGECIWSHFVASSGGIWQPEDREDGREFQEVQGEFYKRTKEMKIGK